MKKPTCEHYVCHEQYQEYKARKVRQGSYFKARVKWSAGAQRWVGTCMLPNCTFHQVKYVTWYPVIFTMHRHMVLAHGGS